MNIFPYRVRFAKTGRMRFLSHHDLMRLFERALRRSGLPLRMSEGYNPHPLISFPTALGLGIESLDEVMEFELQSWVPPRQIEKLLGEQLPEGVSLASVEPFERRRRSRVEFVEYEAVCPGQGEGLDGGIRAFMGSGRFEMERASDKGARVVDVRRYVMAVEREGDRVFLRIRVTDEGTARPDEILRAVGVRMDGTVRLKKTYTEVAARE